MKQLYLLLLLMLPALHLYSQNSSYAKCIAESAELPLQKVKDQIKQKKNLQDLKVFSAEQTVHLETWSNIKNVCHNSYGDHPDFKEADLYNRFFSSIGAKTMYDPSEIKKIAPEIISQYICLKKNYGLRYDIEPEFLSEKEYYKKYADTATNYNPTQYSFMQSLMNSNYDYRLQVQKKMSKCISKNDVDW
ncbi:hypothetical protein [Kaistella faecalis]|uniref:hypothetical protein n=1 Tax=Kaistella faecalis TaxID=2852098 RepID=UPI001C438CFC|nr:hypothetical protein [Chryseobacterium faecale]UFK97553.1 hypothetical protein LL667_11385 [Chryseobacterium faecale]